MDMTKNPLASMGVWGAVFGVLLGFAPVIGPMIGMTPDEATTKLMAIGAGIAAVVALVGRLRATHVLKF